MSIDDHFTDYEEQLEPRSRDKTVDEAKEVLLTSLFHENPEEVYYGRQIEVINEDRFFHWITTKALRELSDEGRIKSLRSPLDNETEVRFYWSKKNRYYRRKLNEIKKLIQEHAQAKFTRAVGDHGEMMFDAALPKEGFMPKATNVREYGGKEWTETGHDLDRVFERDGIPYGTEIKNTMAYIPRSELQIKLRMCARLGLCPLFILRYAPKSYIEQIRQAGGFTLIFKYQLLPHGFADLARRLRERLRLPVDCPRALSEGTIKRLLKWHQKTFLRPSH